MQAPGGGYLAHPKGKRIGASVEVRAGTPVGAT
jgi:hypothetical protein